MTTARPVSPTTPGGEDKVTYTSANIDWDLFHRQFDDALDVAQFMREQSRTVIDL